MAKKIPKHFDGSMLKRSVKIRIIGKEAASDTTVTIKDLLLLKERVEVIGCLNLNDGGLEKDDLKYFSHIVDIHGSLVCRDNRLTSLKGCPPVIRGDFICTNNCLTSLMFSPKQIEF